MNIIVNVYADKIKNVLSPIVDRSIDHKSPEGQKIITDLLKIKESLKLETCGIIVETWALCARNWQYEAGENYDYNVGKMLFLHCAFGDITTVATQNLIKLGWDGNYPITTKLCY